MERLLVSGVAVLLMASTANATDRGDGAQSSGRGAQYVTWRHGTHQGWGVGVARHYRCVVPDVCASGYYAYGYWIGQPKTDCPCQSGHSR
jgi:hypothetical protein